MTKPQQNGCAYLLNKSKGVTSRKASSEVASHWNYRKYGHAGTLDPDAEGLLIVLMGKATRLSQYLISHKKCYRFTLVTGIETDTDDMTGKVIAESLVEKITRDDMVKILPAFTGNFTQTVPVYSAHRIDGVRSYKLARKGHSVDAPTKEVWTGNWQIGEIVENRIELTVLASSGTYVRSLARDIGRALGTYGTADNIVRTAIGEFSINDTSSDVDSPGALLTMSQILKGYQKRIITKSEVIEIQHGRTIDSIDPRPGVIALNDDNGSLIAVAETRGSVAKPVCVFI